MKTELSEDDMSRAVAFIDGAMTEGERASFELRLAADPDLAAAVEALMATDELARRATTARDRDRRRGTVIRLDERRKKRALVAATIAAAAAALAMPILRWMSRDREPRIECAVALAPSFATADEFLASHPELSGLKPPGLDSLRGATDAPNVEAREFAVRAHALEPRPSDSPTPTSPPSITAGYFVVPIETKTSCSVVVLGFPKYGASVRLYPDPADTRPARELGRIEPGSHTLPHERIELASDGASVAYQRGFLVPIHAETMDVLVAVRAEPLDAQTLAAIDEQSTGLIGRERALFELEKRAGFRVTELRVLEPKD
jgi:hypothetical protein